MKANNDYIIESKWGFWDATNKKFDVPEIADVFPTLEKANAELENIEKGFNAFVRVHSKPFNPFEDLPSHIAPSLTVYKFHIPFITIAGL